MVRTRLVVLSEIVIAYIRPKQASRRSKGGIHLSGPHQHVLNAANDAISRGDNDGFLEYCTEDTKWEFVGDRTLNGKAEVRQWLKEAYQRPPLNRVEHLIEDGDTLVAVGEISTFEDGQTVQRRYCDVWRLRDGKLAELQAFVI